MKQTQEFEGKNIEQAIENACSALNLVKKNLKYDVISSGSSGIFGIVGVKKARIRVEISAKKQGTHGKNKKDGEFNDSNGVMSIVDEAFGETKNIGSPAGKTGPRPEKKKIKTARTKPVLKKKTPVTEDTPVIKNTPVTENMHVAEDITHGVSDNLTPVKNDNAADNKIIDKKVSSKVEQTSIETNNFNNEKTDNPNEKKQTDNTWDEGFPPIYKDEAVADVSEESTVLGRETLQKMVDFITTDAVVTAETKQDKLLLKIEGGNSGVLIGRRGQTLEAMQFLTDKIINRKSESRVRLKVDIEGYMETRKANLKSLAFKMAGKAKKTGRPATINQMTAQDRRIVHLALKDDARVRTQSMGDGYYRRLVIFPKKNSYRKKS